MNAFMLILPVLLYMAAMYVIGWYSNRTSLKTDDKDAFLEDYFVGGRSMNGFLLAMTLITTYTSASSFIGGPGLAYTRGLGWVLLSMIQVPTAFFTLGVLGKKFAIVSRKIKAVTVTDFLRERYKSDVVVILGSISLLVFFMASMVAQFIGGARLFETITGYPYIIGLIIFGITVIIYTTVGGFKAVALTDGIQGVVMIGATLALLIGTIRAGGGMENIMQKLYETDPMILSPFGAGNSIAKPYLLSFWVLVGFAVLGLPQTTSKCMGYKDSKSLHNAIFLGTAILGFMMLGMHLVGVLGRAVIPGITNGDLAIPTITLKLMPPFFAGLFLAGPLAAIMSTVDSMLILSSAAIVKDLYVNYFKKDAKASVLSRLSTWTTLIVGAIVFLAAINPPSLIVWINLFAFGGLEATFLWATLLGLYWKRANAAGAIASMIVGLVVFFYLMINKITYLGMHQIVLTVIASLLAFVIGSYVGKKPDDKIIETFWG